MPILEVACSILKQKQRNRLLKVIGSAMLKSSFQFNSQLKSILMGETKTSNKSTFWRSNCAADWAKVPNGSKRACTSIQSKPPVVAPNRQIIVPATDGKNSLVVQTKRMRALWTCQPEIFVIWKHFSGPKKSREQEVCVPKAHDAPGRRKGHIGLR